MAHEIERPLYRLAGAAWNVRRITPSHEFILRPQCLHQPDSPRDMAAVVGQLYTHARIWAPGFEIPYRVPYVSMSPLINSAGQYRVDSDGYLFIEVSPEFKGQHSALLAILAHEACHHILDLSGIRGSTPQEGETLTDLAAFICGFGEIILSGHSPIRRAGSGWATTHLGYLSAEEYRAAQHWVLRVQGLHHAAPPAHTRGFLARIKSWVRGDNNSLVTHVANPPPPLFDATTHRRKVALTRLGGDRALLERLIEYERRRQPGANDLTLLDAVIESLERDRR